MVQLTTSIVSGNGLVISQLAITRAKVDPYHDKTSLGHNELKCYKIALAGHNYSSILDCYTDQAWWE